MMADFGAMLPAAAEQLISAVEISRIVARMAGEIARDLATSDPIVMPILIGGAFTAVRLAEHFRFPYEIDSVRVGRYGAGTVGGELHWSARPGLDLNGRHVLLVDDVLDRGMTLQAVEHELRRLNAASVSAAVLVRKTLNPAIERPPLGYVGVDVPDRFLFGCGMDLEGRWRGLPALYALRRE
jgi:hypoxanthine phosphoribosyltransferase